MNAALDQPQSGTSWDRLAVRARWMRRAKLGAIYGFLIAVSVPVLLPFFWMASVAFSSKTGTVETVVLWRSMAVLVPFVLACWICSTIGATARQMFFGYAAITGAAVIAFVVFVLPDLHLGNFIFMTEKDFSNTVRARRSGVKLGDFAGGINFPSVWSAFANSLYLAGGQTLIVATVSSLAGYYLSRFKFAGRAAMLRTLLALHAFPVLDADRPAFPYSQLRRSPGSAVGRHVGAGGVRAALRHIHHEGVLRRRALGNRDERPDRRRLAPSGLCPGRAAAGIERHDRRRGCSRSSAAGRNIFSCSPS